MPVILSTSQELDLISEEICTYGTRFSSLGAHKHLMKSNTTIVCVDYKIIFTAVLRRARKPLDPRFIRLDS